MNFCRKFKSKSAAKVQDHLVSDQGSQATSGWLVLGWVIYSKLLQFCSKDLQNYFHFFKNHSKDIKIPSFKKQHQKFSKTIKSTIGAKVIDCENGDRLC